MEKNDLWIELIPLFKSAIRGIRSEWHKQVGDHLTHTQLYLLSKLYKHGPLKSADLAEKLNVTNSTLTAIVDKLCDKGLVERERSELDRRAVIINITEEGQSLAISFKEYEIRAFRKFIDRLSSEDLIHFKEILIKLNLPDRDELQ
ncbi:MarR family winged helix-turn-helix transcriptional regulator [Cohnella herbarum]|uniref:MarR family transcriptional regulator n=1 Tax=Cohnella herbarum TaxID=2728023 RepID=A0A7Z2VKG1_9BACL|nr:MarR family transcriptional regulator [Cohnella herbarum]QJD84903.1 MarR family transcriptional regulator [Cohnella herbarum]